MEDTLITLLLHCLIPLYLLWLQWSSWWRCCLGHCKNTCDDDGVQFKDARTRDK